MLQRISKDMSDFAKNSNKAQSYKLIGLSSPSEVREVVTNPRGKAASELTARLEGLVKRLEALRKTDTEYVAYALPAASRTANHIDVGVDRSSILLHLRRFARKEATLAIDYLIASLCSNAETEWVQLNPFLPTKTASALINLVAVAILRANRIGHINRVVEGTNELLHLLSKARKNADEAVPHAIIEAVIASLSQKADSVASQLNAQRVYVNQKTMEYDPRFLIFEFTWNLVLRRRQMELIGDMHSSIDRGASIVKQMIMGAGKTTVVGPLLALMLANTKNLVIQVVPPALLDFTRAVLRTTFSSVLQKQIFTFDCDRATDIDSELLSKFQHAKDSRGIVVTTPSSIKSIFLKYVEGLDHIVDVSRAGRRPEMEKEAQDLLRVLGMFKEGVLIMDEVDLLLHPLKSELNFPIGVKYDIDYTPIRWKLPIHLIDAIFYYHTRRITISMKDSPAAHETLLRFRAAVQKGLTLNALQEMPHLVLLNLEYYDEVLKPILAEWLVYFLKAQHFLGLSDAETLQYIQCRPKKTEKPDFVAKVEALEDAHVKMLNLANEWLNCFMPHIMQKIDRVSFGIMNKDDMKRAREEHPQMPRSRFVTAIPFVGKDLPSQSSEFAHPDVVIGLTVLAFRYEGLRDTDFLEIMRDVHAMVEKEVGRYNQRRTNIMYTKWVQSAGGKLLSSYKYHDGKRGNTAEEEIGMQPSESIVFTPEHTAEVEVIAVLPLKLMRQANEEESNKLFKLFCRCPEVIHWYLCESIFPEFMRHQRAKLSASGQEMGGNIMFPRRIGFSGTPSDLLPVELGRCGYEIGTDGQLIHTLTNPQVMNFHVAESGWTVRGLLDWIANANPPFHALIDTGALITGMSNLQVAQYLLKHGLPHMEGVVFLDEFDRKMILVRATGRVLKLAECGIPKVKRFAFYDQVHTTGMDIEHTPNAQAVCTLGKDMTFRDFSQGCYRMRGIGEGQTVCVLFIPEVYELMNRTLSSTRRSRIPDQVSDRPSKDVLVDITAWLVVNSIRSEHTQHNQLCLQNCANVWRKEAFRVLSDRVSDFKVSTAPPESSSRALQLFREPVSFDLPTHVPQPCMFSESVSTFAAQSAHFVTTDEGRAVVQSIVDQTKREDEIDNPVIDVQMVQEQEEEKEAEQEQEKEQEIEIEKFVDLAYSRDDEIGIPWMLETLRKVGDAKQFTAFSDFHLYKRRPIAFPDSLLLSRNYFDARWSGHRRMKNVIVTLEWIPSTKGMTPRDAPSEDYGVVPAEQAHHIMDRTVKMLKEHQGDISKDLLRDLIYIALHIASPTEAEWNSVLLAAMKKMKQHHETGHREMILNLLNGNYLRGEETGRYTVAVSLAEAETLRRVMHIKKMRGEPFLPNGDTEIALRMAPSNNALLEASTNFCDSPTTYFSARNYQCLRYFDCDLHYTDADFGVLLRSLHRNPTKHRQAFFQQVIACRRRARQRWEKTPIALLFTISHALTLLHQRAVGLCLKRELEAKDLNLGDAFLAFNSSHSGVLTPEEVWGAAIFCRLSLCAEDILDFIQVADSHHEGNIHYPDFLSVLTGSSEIDEGGDTPNQEETQGKKLPTVEPYGAEELKKTHDERLSHMRAQEAEANKEIESENKRVIEEIEAEQIRAELELLRDAGNPSLEPTAVCFDFASKNLPKLTNTSGAGVVCRFKDEEQGDCILMQNNSALKVSLRSLKHLINNQSLIERYTLSTEFKIPKVVFHEPKNGALKKLSDISGKILLFSWVLPKFAFRGQSCVGSLEFEPELFEAQKEAKKQAKKGKKESDGREASGTTEDDEAAAKDDEEDAAEEGDEEREGAEEEGEEGEGEECDDDDDVDDGDGDEEEEGEEDEDRMHIFSAPHPSLEGIVGEVNDEDVVESAGEKATTNIDGTNYEWMKIKFKDVEGWVVKEVQGESLWTQHTVEVKLGQNGNLTISIDAETDESNVNIGQILGLGNDADEDLEIESNDDEDEEDEDDWDALQLGGDVGDLLEAVRKAKELHPGDKVTRNPECWEHGNDDGGEGKVGKVLKVENEKVTVQWPSGNKGDYIWGENGKFELIKVGEAEEGDEGEIRETMNDERWIAELRKTPPKCSACSKETKPGNWFRCNHCENYHLCKKCFNSGEHADHDFSDMGSLAEINRSTEIVIGSWVRIKRSIQEPSSGWVNGLSVNSVGMVLELEKDMNQIVVDFEETDGPTDWTGLYTEVELTDPPKRDEKEGASGAKTRSIPALEFLEGVSCTLGTYHGITALTRSGQRPQRFIVGDRVEAFYDSYGCTYAFTVQTVLPDKKYHLYSETDGISADIDESKMKFLKCDMGAKVRFKRDVTDPQYGWGHLEGQARYRTTGEVTYVGGGGGDFCYLNVDFGNGAMSCCSNEVESVNKIDVRWYIKFNEPLKEGEPLEYLLSTSGTVTVERGFSDGLRSASITFKDASYTVEFSTLSAKNSKGDVVGTVRREPHEKWAESKPPKKFDDDTWHVLSLIVSGNDIQAFCDGETVPISYEGELSSKVAAIRQALKGTDQNVPPSPPQAAKKPKPKRAWADDEEEEEEEEDSDVEPVITDEDRKEAAKRTIASYFPLVTTIPLMVFTSDQTAESYRTNWGANVGQTFPRRLVTLMKLDWGEPKPNEIVSWHRGIEAAASWTCTHCKGLNDRHVAECSECLQPRTAKKTEKERIQGKIRAFIPRSREAHAVRTKLQQKLRSLYQKELDFLDEGAGRSRGHRGGGGTVGPQLL